jgi:hypothetical protein
MDCSPRIAGELLINLTNNPSHIAGIGVGNDGWGYHYSDSASGLQVVVNNPQQCPIKPPNGDQQRCETIKLASP